MKRFLASLLLTAWLVPALSAQMRERKIGDIGFMGGFGSDANSHVTVSVQMYPDSSTYIVVRLASLSDLSDYATVRMSMDEAKRFTDSLNVFLDRTVKPEKGESLKYFATVIDSSQNKLGFMMNVESKTTYFLSAVGIGSIRSVFQPVNAKGARQFADLLTKAMLAVVEMRAPKPNPCDVCDDR